MLLLFSQEWQASYAWRAKGVLHHVIRLTGGDSKTNLRWRANKIFISSNESGHQLVMLCDTKSKIGIPFGSQWQSARITLPKVTKTCLATKLRHNLTS